MGTVVGVTVGYGTVSRLSLIAVICSFLPCFGLNLPFYIKYGLK